MANTIYPKGREGFATAAVGWTTDTIKAVLVDSGYTYNSAHDFLDDVGAGARVATSSALAGKTATDGVCDANDVTYSTLPAGDTITGVIVYKDSGAEATSRLLVWYDTKADATAISVATNGGDVVVQWANSGNYMFKI